MQIVIPMSGIGQRFINAGYDLPKPLIQVDGKPIIEHVVHCFSGETDFIFICNEKHLKTTELEKTLKMIAPTGKIISIQQHKLGPVYAVAQAFEHIYDQQEVIVNYCDFSKFWNYHDFLQHTRDRNADGAICAYKGFHPHMLGKTNYAFMRDDQQWMQEIQEKKPFTNNRTQEYASDGTYYFKTGVLVKKYFQELMDQDINLNGEYYISLIYNLMRKDNLNVSIYEIQHMLQWGEPKDLEEYQRWSNIFELLQKQKTIIAQTKKNSINLIPLAGRGQRFVDASYQIPKPLIDVNGTPMIIQASQCLPDAQERIFVCLKDHLEQYPLKATLINQYPQAQIKTLNGVTEGQACSCKEGLDSIDTEAPLLIAASDNSMIYDQEHYQDLLKDPDIDCIVWSFRHHPTSAANPQMYGWIEVNQDNNIINVSVKKAISDKPFEDHAIVGTFYFRKARFFLEALASLQKKNSRVNNEFYVDSCINECLALGLKAKVFEIDHYICWGTPNDLKTYEYWQSFFHKCQWHPYNIIKDNLVPNNKAQELIQKATTFKQTHI